MSEIYTFVTPGIPDDYFIRGNVPMTKEEIRALTISKLRLKPDHTIVDIGAGTGSISIECSLLARNGRLIAVEKDDEAVGLIKENAEQFGADNIEILHGTAPEILKGITEVDRVVIGGTGGRMKDIIKECYRVLKDDGIVVINCILLENLSECLNLLKCMAFKNINTICVNISRGRILGGKTMMQPLNPVYIISAEKEENDAR